MAQNSSTVSPAPTSQSSAATLANRLRNFLIVMVAVVLSLAVFLGLQGQTVTASLETQAKAAVPLETALVNGKPTLMEFYADWCTSCQAMADDLETLKQTYGERVNFVMLNVDNSKWLPEILSYRVDGIPHFVFLNQAGDAIASAIGEQPRPILATNLDALVAGEALPYAQASGQTSSFSSPVSAQGQTDPRSHGSQVVN
ncbi:thiol:disulfide interchange protein [Leptolyngbya sp. 'hensonii']|uniref:thioredoxin family protein n=1 Tax=Leptolyngbya sp. 'hensonii' TaxID=1922337 RepID=UPI00094F64CE|nr:thioredoxin family protein [Leptolyngbya sp. 'hensonii']OLP19238.1 thiol:disulfide interchange protein [Leptolyngbya sp. 'hensonii']